MNGEYNGFAAWMLKENPNQILVWCYAHILNLVISDTCGSILSSLSLFRLSTIGETSLWSKDTALKKIFGEFSNTDSGLYVVLVSVLYHIENNSHFKFEVCQKAKRIKRKAP
ncbi:hypothetical protein HELRODRAFT_162731 [Helobdella robusta]|uniref:DUF4371 domain-containing protein n=1 Tax=Helobdella robusta TaxID=6412 RepID=T1ET24_HELRO|nr:hypothetical protein HELRODRAFT_162731 [Helobdella robusta]ESN99219.1 hypothetical protein HELRODRAFT_162731 [Helobdella robusta]